MVDAFHEFRRSRTVLWIVRGNQLLLMPFHAFFIELSSIVYVSKIQVSRMQTFKQKSHRGKAYFTDTPTFNRSGYFTTNLGEYASK